MIQLFRIADLTFSLEYPDETSPLAVVARKNEMIRVQEGDPRIRFQWSGSLGRLPGACTTLGKGMVSADSFQLKIGSNLVFRMQRREADWLVGIAPVSSGAAMRFRDLLKKGFKYSFLYGCSAREMRAKKIMYGIMEPVFLLWLSRHGKTLVHCSAVERNGRSILFPAWGGVGKTSLMACFLENGWKYLCDDIAVLSRDGELYHYPLPMHIYGYHKYACPDMYRRMYSRMTARQRLVWNLSMALKSPTRMSRWVAPQTVYGRDRIVLRSSLGAIVHMQRTSADIPLEMRRSEPARVARYMANTILNEVKGIAPLTTCPNSVAGDMGMPDLEELVSDVKDTIRSAAGRVPGYELVLGAKTSPQDTWDHLKTHLLKDLSW